MSKIVASGPSIAATGRYRIADLVLDAGRREISRNGEQIELGKLTYALLLELVSRAPNVVTHDELVERIWGGRTTSPETVTQRVKMLRDALGDDAEQPRYIALVRGHGYRLIPVVEADEQPVAATSVQSSPWHGARLLGVALLLVVTAAAGLSFVRDHPAPQSGDLPTLAVLPCENQSADPADADFAAGLQPELLYRLGKLDGLHVIPRTSAQVFADPATRPPITDVADRLGAQYVLECSISRAGRETIVAFELIDPKTGVVVLPERYRVNLNDLGTVFAAQSSLAARIAETLETGYSPTEQARIERIPTHSPEAYALYLRAVDRDNREAIELLNEAIRFDPEFALAHAALALRSAYSFQNLAIGPAASGQRRAGLEAHVREHAERALALDAEATDALAALGYSAFVNWRWTEADAFFMKAIASAPPMSDLPYRIEMILLSAEGRHDEAIALAYSAREFDPGSPHGGDYGLALGYAGEYEAAARELEHSISAWPTDGILRNWLAYLYVAIGNPDAAIQQIEVAEGLTVDDRAFGYLGQWAYVYSRAGRREDAARIVERMEQAATNGTYFGTGVWAMAYLAVGDQARALEQLEVAATRAANHEPDESLYALLILQANVTNDPVLRQPEFVEVLSRIRGD